MSKALYGALLGGILGVFDGLSALVSAPETQPQIIGIVAGSTFKGVLAGAIIGWFATRVHSAWKGALFGLSVSGFLAFLIAVMPNDQGGHYWWQIILPGSVLGIIVGYATQRWAAPLNRAAPSRTA